MFCRFIIENLQLLQVRSTTDNCIFLNLQITSPVSYVHIYPQKIIIQLRSHSKTDYQYSYSTLPLFFSSIPPLFSSTPPLLLSTCVKPAAGQLISWLHTICSMYIKQRILELYQYCVESSLDVSLNLWSKGDEKIFSLNKTLSNSQVQSMDREKTKIPNTNT